MALTPAHRIVLPFSSKPTGCARDSYSKFLMPDETEAYPQLAREAATLRKAEPARHETKVESLR